MNDVRTLDGSGPVEVAIGDEGDLPRIVDLLNDVAANSIASFDARPIKVDERRAWFERFSSAGPYRLLVARRDGRVVGYACSQRYRDHDAFRETVELSVAIDASCRGLGVGTSLYRALFESIADEPIHVAVVGIAMPNDASVALHRKFGFTEVGTFHEYAVKDGQYISSLWMERLL
ncbi:N-acetyltransferase family protein [Nonomuraea terrae]|uniref:N-acetyltransferase family protein n=1 Tax=Nonomuraea terrae TaxID=2530383 RepID=A0A4R4Z137_9ACTN|nr:GNAT family N-acetyltransferase [Nonomuraea terrae]TDD51585.1 N-acetyltransferase family protein [Nonomuraea terrae]